LRNYAVDILIKILRAIHGAAENHQKRVGILEYIVTVVTEQTNIIMKKAKVILTAIAVFAVIGGALAFKTSRFNEFQLWTLNGATTVSVTTIVGGLPLTYTATVPNCVITNRYATDDSPVFGFGRLSSQFGIRGTVIGGTATTLIPYTACPSFQTFITLLP
jgi:hypothetical protein